MLFHGASALKLVLQQYESASGQSINPAKSAISFSRKTPISLKARIKDTLEIHKEGGVGKYLGLPEHFGKRKRDLFASIVDRIQTKASSWSNRFLSTAGKMVMLQSVLTPIPSYAMTCFKLPVSLCDRIQSALTRFWWDGKDGNKKLAWVSWDKMTQPKHKGGLGFKDFQSFNNAFLGKLAWRLLHNPSCLLSRILKGKYHQDSSILQATHKSVESYGWKGLLVGRDLILHNSGWVVGNGESIRVWDDPWLSCSEQQRPMGPPPANQSDLRVSSLILANGSDWDLEAIRRLIPLEESRILNIKLSKTGASDKLVWLGTSSGEYTTKTGYRAALETPGLMPTEPTISLNWTNGIWRLPIASKLKLFLWKMFRGALPVGECLASRTISSALLCKRCNSPESINHLFLHCGLAHEVWRLAPFVTSIDSRGLIDLVASWPSLCDAICLPPSGIAAGPLAPWILWHLWLARNNYIFNNKESLPRDILSKAIKAAHEWLSEQSSEPTPRPPTRKECTLKPPDSVLVQSDAAWRADISLAELGWIVTENETKTSLLAHCHFVNSALIAEGLAVREAISYCLEKDHRRIHIQSDSFTLVKALTTGPPVSEIYGIVADIVCLSAAFDSISFSWVPRLKNRDADSLAKQALRNESFVMNHLNVVF